MPAISPLSLNQTELLRSICLDSFEHFVRRFWKWVPGAGDLIWNWHLSVLCKELQDVAERVFAGLPRLHNTIINISPGTSKSSIASILFPAWCWARMPSCRILSASHTSDLVLDLATKSRWVIESEEYHRLFPQVEMRSDQNAKGYYANTLGGDRYTCTVAGKSPMGFHCHIAIVDDPIDPKKAVSETELKSARDFFEAVLPSRVVDKSVSAMALIMQRLHDADPTGHLLKKAKVDGATKVRHICLPAELDKREDGTYSDDRVSPPELAEHYKDGLMDPVRLPRRFLEERKADSLYAYAGQYLQSPNPPGGSMFRREYFNQRVKAAPYDCRRVRYWDRAALEGAGCATAGTLLAVDSDGRWYVEDCIRGQWEPFKRDEIIMAAAHRDRLRYFKHEPRIYIEQEGGSSGIDSAKHTVSKMAGFPVFFDRPTGSKEVRAESWSSACAAKNVFIVEGDWDIEGWIEEHCLFPNGSFLDRVDSSSGAFNRLAERTRKGAPRLRVIPLRPGKKNAVRVVILSREQAEDSIIEETALLVNFLDPGEVGIEGGTREFSHATQKVASNGELLEGHNHEELNGSSRIIESGEGGNPPPSPGHACQKLLGSLDLHFADVDPREHQENWESPLPAFGRTASEVMMSVSDGMRLWSFLTRRHDPAPQSIVLIDDGDRRARSAGYAVADALGLGREAIFLPEDDGSGVKGLAPNPHVYDIVKQCRHRVLG